MGARRGTPHLLWVITLLTLAALLVWAAFLPGRTPTVFAEGDPAVIELYTWQATHGVWAYGPYSRFGWHHPGPLYFYLLAPFYAISGDHTLALDAGAFAINLVALTVAAWALLRYVGKAMALAVLLAMAAYLFQISRLLVSVWNPHVLLVPFAALIVTGAIAMSGRLALLPIVIALASFVSQTHAGLLPCAAAVVVCSLVGCVWHMRALAGSRRSSHVQAAAAAASSTRTAAERPPRWQLASREWRWLALSGGVVAVLWALPIVEQVTSPNGGNLTAIAHFFGPSGPAGAGISFGDAIAVWADALTSPARVPYGNTITITHSWLPPTLATIEVVLLGLAAWQLRRRRRATEAALALLCAIATVMALVSIARIRGGLVDHLVGWVTLLGIVNVGVLIGVACTWIDERAPRLATPLAWASSITAVALVVTVAWYGGSRIEWQRQEVIRKASGGRTPTQALYQELRTTLAKAHIRKPLLHAAMLSWPQAAGIALQLTKKDVPFASDLVWLFGPQVTPRGDEDADITIADTPTRHTLSQRPGDCMILERHGTSLHLLAIPPERFTSLVCVAP
jgi:hypothetical protein